MGIFRKIREVNLSFVGVPVVAVGVTKGAGAKFPLQVERHIIVPFRRLEQEAGILFQVQAGTSDEERFPV